MVSLRQLKPTRGGLEDAGERSERAPVQLKRSEE